MPPKGKKKFHVKVRKLGKPPKGKSIQGYNVQETAMLLSNHTPAQRRILKHTAKRNMSGVRNKDAVLLDARTGHVFGGV